jgi:hypothetical protein
MAIVTNSTSGIFSMIPGALNRASAAPKFTNAILDSVFLDDRPAVGSVGQTIEVLIPTVNASNVSFIGAGPVVPHNAAQTAVALSVTQKASNTYMLPTYNSALTEIDLAKFYIGPWLEELVRKVGFDFTNTLIGGASPGTSGVTLPSSSNFAANTIVTGSGGHPTRANISTATAELFAQGAPVDDESDMFLITSGNPYYAMVADTTFSYQYIVGNDASADANQKAYLVNINGARILKDQNFPVGTGSTPTYYAALYHRFAHAARFLVEQTPMNKVAYEQIIYPKPGMPVRVEWWYDPFNQGAFCSLTALYGVAVTRDSYRCLITC